MLNHNLDKNFIRSIIEIKRDPKLSSFYRLYVAKYTIPIITDVVLIDYGEVFILTYLEQSLGLTQQLESYPIKMEVIRGNGSLMSGFYNTINQYIVNAGNGLVEQLSTAEEIEEWYEKKKFLTFYLG